MKLQLSVSRLLIVVVAFLALPSWLAAQHRHYKVVDMGTFGGLQSYVPEGADIAAARFLNSKGMLVGSADTSKSDPSPDFCFVEDCLVAHAFLGKKSG